MISVWPLAVVRQRLPNPTSALIVFMHTFRRTTPHKTPTPPWTPGPQTHRPPPRHLYSSSLCARLSVPPLELCAPFAGLDPLSFNLNPDLCCAGCGVLTEDDTGFVLVPSSSKSWSSGWSAVSSRSLSRQACCTTQVSKVTLESRQLHGTHLDQISVIVKHTPILIILPAIRT